MATNNTRKTTNRRPRRAKAEISSTRSLTLGTLSAGALIGAIAAGVFGLIRMKRAQTGGEHVPTDLMGDEHPGATERAVDAFRPDPAAPIPDEERDGFRPALAGAAAPTLVAGQAKDNARLDAAPS